ncbi:MAG: hypothetical protein ACSLEN_07615 [Candidatus Malihini olakiniferum]
MQGAFHVARSHHAACQQSMNRSTRKSPTRFDDFGHYICILQCGDYCPAVTPSVEHRKEQFEPDGVRLSVLLGEPTDKIWTTLTAMQHQQPGTPISALYPPLLVPIFENAN